MSQLFNAIFSPKKEGLTGNKRPVVLIVHSPYDTGKSSIGFDAAKKTLGDWGYSYLNKKRLTFGELSASELKGCIRENYLAKPVTLWLESHGALGWLFGGSDNAKAELNATLAFAKFVRVIENHISARVETIVLSGCYTATELINHDKSTYMNSPARLLSIILNDTHIVGFVGQNACARVTHIYHEKPKEIYEEVNAALQDAAILYRAGKVIESYHQTTQDRLFCTHVYTPQFIKKYCALIYDDNACEESYYPVCLAQEVIQKNPWSVRPNCFGHKQLEYIQNNLHLADVPTEPSAETETTEGYNLVMS